MPDSEQENRQSPDFHVDVKPGAGETFSAQFERVMQGFGEFLDGYERANPEWLKIGTLRLVHDAIYRLKACLDNPRDRDTAISWKTPIAEISYPFEVDWETIDKAGWESLGIERPGLTLFTVTGEDLKDHERLADKLAEGFNKTEARSVFELLAGGKPFDLEVTQVIDHERRGLLLSPKLGERISKLPEERREKALAKLAQRGKWFSFRFDAQVTVTPDKLKGTTAAAETQAAKTDRLRGTVSVKFNPFVIDRDNRQAYYPVYVGISLRGLRAEFTPDKWSEEVKRSLSEEILGGFLKTIQEQTPTEKFPELKSAQEIPKPQVKSLGTAMVKSSLHLEGQRFGRAPALAQTSLFDETAIMQERAKWGIEVVGIDATKAQENALFALQRLFSEIGYQGNEPGRELDHSIRANPFKFTGTTPTLKFTPAQYLEAYGVSKTETGRGKREFSVAERTEALQALRDLADKRYLLYYERRYWVDGEERFDVIKTIRPLIIITQGYEALTRLERDTVKGGQTSNGTDQKLKAIVIEPAPIFVDQLDRYYLLKPANYRQELKIRFPNASKYLYRFVDYLLYTAEQAIRHHDPDPWTIRIGFDKLGYKLRMYTWINSRNWKAMRTSLTRCYDQAKEAGWLLGYKTEPRPKTRGLEVFTLNPEKFNRRADQPEPLPQKPPEA